MLDNRRQATRFTYALTMSAEQSRLGQSVDPARPSHETADRAASMTDGGGDRRDYNVVASARAAQVARVTTVLRRPSRVAVVADSCCCP
jgi:hypothetical protein